MPTRKSPRGGTSGYYPATISQSTGAGFGSSALYSGNTATLNAQQAARTIQANQKYGGGTAVTQRGGGRHTWQTGNYGEVADTATVSDDGANGAIGTGGTGPGGDYTLDDLYDYYQRALDSANEANEARYEEGKQGWQENYDRQMAYMDQVASSGEADMQRYYEEMGAELTQAQINRGIYNSTNATAMDLELASRKNQDINRFKADVAQQKADLDARATGELLDFIERRTDEGPSYDQMIQLAMSLGQGNSGEGAAWNGVPVYGNAAGGMSNTPQYQIPAGAWGAGPAGGGAGGGGGGVGGAGGQVFNNAGVGGGGNAPALPAGLAPHAAEYAATLYNSMNPIKRANFEHNMTVLTPKQRKKFYFVFSQLQNKQAQGKFFREYLAHAGDTLRKYGILPPK